MNTEELLAKLGAVGHAQRLRIVAELYRSAQAGERLHVSELARRLGLSRALLYMHLERLETAGMVTGQLELSDDGKAMKYFELMPFALTLDAETIAETVARDAEPAPDANTKGGKG
ncbi:ArsR/SmtB family transcription factor [Catenulispora sp. GP43]|uniref:ArsR/SmtB family transcription factor n=1 Tax=Catenulispora sp. GP43 TaxID=3156263 RepID=UPI0035179B7E